MKWIEVIAWGNEKKHWLPMDQIVDVNFGEDYTTITLTSGKTLNIKELEPTIKEMFRYHQANLVNENDIRTFYEGMAEFQSDLEPPYYGDDDYELPF